MKVSSNLKKFTVRAGWFLVDTPIYINIILFEMIVLAVFYTFKTKEGYEVSLTFTHNILVYVPEKNQIEYLRASKVTLKHRLIMFGRKVEIESISMNFRTGYYSPLTLSSYLYVNNISTSVF